MFLRATPSVTISGLIFNSTPTNLDPIEVAMNLAVILVLVDRLLVRMKEMRGELDTRPDNKISQWITFTTSLSTPPLILMQFQLLANCNWVDTFGNRQCSNSGKAVAKRRQSFSILVGCISKSFHTSEFLSSPRKSDLAKVIQTDRIFNVRSISILPVTHASNHHTASS